MRQNKEKVSRLKKYVVFDIGGSSIKYGLLQEDSTIVEKSKFSVPEKWTLFIDKIVSIIIEFREKYEISGVAISAPGAVDYEKGVIGGSSAIPYIHGPNFKEEIYKKTGVRAEIENDANCAALAEVWRGAAKDCQNVAFFICGTGVGGCIIKNRSVHHGAHLHGGEFGYCVLDMIDGKPKTLSELGATGALVRNVKLLKMISDTEIDGVKIFDMAERGDAVCLAEVNKFYYYLALGMYNIQYTYDPEMIILGGAVSERADILERINDKMGEILKALPAAKVKPIITRCEFLNDANLIGALFHYLQMSRNVD